MTIEQFQSTSSIGVVAADVLRSLSGLDHNETRSCFGWRRHVSLVMLAFAMLAIIRHHAYIMPPPKTLRRMTRLRS